MKYLIEQFKWHNKEYYHLVNSQIFESQKYLPEKGYSKNGSYFVITKLDDEIQGRKRG